MAAPAGGAPGSAREKPYKRQVSWAGLPVTVDRPKGHVIEGVDSVTGQPYRVEYAVDYGYLRRTRGGDGEGLDVFLGPDETQEAVFWVTHLKDDGTFDEFKVFLGYASAVDAHAEYLRHYPARWYGGTREGTIHQLRALLCLDPTHPSLDAPDPRGAIERVFDRRMAAANAAIESRTTLRDWAEAHTRLLDLGPGDVHIPGAGNYRPGPPTRPAKRPKELQMADLKAAQRDALPASSFAIPKERKYPIHDAAHVRDAESYLEKEHHAGKISDAQYASAKGKIARAAKKFGIESKYNATDAAPAPRPNKRRVHVRADVAEGGSLHVRHLRDGDNVLMPGGFQIPGKLSLALSALAEAETAVARLDAASEAGAKATERVLTLRAEAEKPVWIQIGKAGYWAGHPQGPFQLNEQIFHQIKKNFDATANHEIPVDFEHATEKPVTEGSIAQHGAPAQGWIREMKIQGSGLYGLVNWGPEARDLIRDKKYKYISPAIRFNSKDRVTGELIGARMTSAALTNNPWIDGMEAVAAKDTPGATTQQLELRGTHLAHSPGEYMPDVKKALRMPELCSAAECSDNLARLRALHDADMEDDQDGVHDGLQLDDYRMPLRQLSGATPGDTWDDVFDTVEDMIGAAMGRHVVTDHDQPADGALATDAITADDAPTDTGVDDSGEMTMAATEEKISRLETENATLLSDKKTLTTVTEQLTSEKKSLSERIAALETSFSTEKTALLDDKKALTTEKTKLELRVQELTGELAKIGEEIKTLRDEKVKRDDDAQTARVEKAFKQWGKKKNLTEGSKKGMLVVLKDDPSYFETEYPLVDDADAHLLNAKTAGRREPPPPPMPKDGKGPVRGPKLTLRQMAVQISRERHITLSDAMVVADDLARRNRALEGPGSI